MRPELRDKLLGRFDAIARYAGAADFDAMMWVFSKLLSVVQEKVAPMRTKEDLARSLDQMPDPSILEEKLMLAVLTYAPQIAREGLRRLANAAERELPALPRGRPGADLQTQARIVAYAGELHTRGYSLEMSKKSAARKFHVSEGSVQRYWDDRGSMEDADFRSALRWLTEGEKPLG